VLVRGGDQLTAAKKLKGRLDGAFRETRPFREEAEAGGHGFPFRAARLAVEVEINEIRGRLPIVADDIAHENVEDVVVD
jgi:hypothetical protein